MASITPMKREATIVAGACHGTLAVELRTAAWRLDMLAVDIKPKESETWQSTRTSTAQRRMSKVSRNTWKRDGGIRRAKLNVSLMAPSGCDCWRGEAALRLKMRCKDTTVVSSAGGAPQRQDGKCRPATSRFIFSSIYEMAKSY